MRLRSSVGRRHSHRPSPSSSTVTRRQVRRTHTEQVRACLSAPADTATHAHRCHHLRQTARSIQSTATRSRPPLRSSQPAVSHLTAFAVIIVVMWVSDWHSFRQNYQKVTPEFSFCSLAEWEPIWLRSHPSYCQVYLHDWQSNTWR